jgi:hypothetical protein
MNQREEGMKRLGIADEEKVNATVIIAIYIYTPLSSPLHTRIQLLLSL